MPAKMILKLAFSNITTTTTTNSTEGFDPYCRERPIGPIIWAGISVLSGCVGLPASVWLLWVLVQRQRSGMTNDVYMLNLTAMDLIFNAFAIPGMLNYFVWRDHFVNSVHTTTYTLISIGRPLFMTSMCVDCFIAVLYPIVYMKMKRSRHRLLSCAAVWGFTLCIGIISAFQIRTSLIAPVVFYFLSVPTIVICDLAVLYTLRKPDPSGRTGVHPQKQRALQTITTSLVMTLVCYLPMMVVSPFLSYRHISDLVRMCVIIFLANSAPLIGGIVMPLLQLHNFGRLGRLKHCTCVSGLCSG